METSTKDKKWNKHILFQVSVNNKMLYNGRMNRVLISACILSCILSQLLFK